MKLLPFDNLKFKTTLSSEQVLERLNEVVEPGKLFRYIGFGDKPYYGNVSERAFKISMRKPINESGVVINGNLENDFRGCTVLVRMRLPFLSILLLIMLMFGLFSALLSELHTVFSGVDSNYEGLMSGYSGIILFTGITIVNYFYLLVIFKDNVKKVKEQFSKLFETDDVEELGFEWQRDRGFD